ncbi:atypical CYS HIS rich thioredoxin 4 [Hibiscus trionum]|uniref:Atypical CYS HIS rich thioredoxin 4 n=1 Tax=Hibiscus trionum TaxID=183268 RepID=A0A9W7HDP0_HIBTR|nr:atypical CYS HIS rich thioredoxin 4 [Hibiscus trionum]
MMILQIKKFKNALAKHKSDRCSLAPTKGLDEKKFLALASNKDFSFNYTPNPVQPAPLPTAEEIPASKEKLPTTSFEPKESEKKTLVGVGDKM